MLPNDWQTWRVFRLTAQQYEELQHRLEEDDELRGLFEDIVQYDWVPPYTTREGAKGSYILRKPSNLHVLLTARVQCAISKDIEELVVRLRESGDEKVARAVEAVFGGGSPILALHAPKLEDSSQHTRLGGREAVVIERAPAATFWRPVQAALPSTVVEMGYSSDWKNLSRFAKSYVVDSPHKVRHKVRCVVAVDIPYQKTITTKECKE